MPKDLTRARRTLTHTTLISNGCTANNHLSTTRLQTRQTPDALNNSRRYQQRRPRLLSRCSIPMKLPPPRAMPSRCLSRRGSPPRDPQRAIPRTGSSNRVGFLGRMSRDRRSRKTPAASTALRPPKIQIMRSDLRMTPKRRNSLKTNRSLVLKEDGCCGGELRWLSKMGRRRCERLC